MCPFGSLHNHVAVAEVSCGSLHDGISSHGTCCQRGVVMAHAASAETFSFGHCNLMLRHCAVALRHSLLLLAFVPSFGSLHSLLAASEVSCGDVSPFQKSPQCNWLHRKSPDSHGSLCRFGCLHNPFGCCGSLLRHASLPGSLHSLVAATEVSWRSCLVLEVSTARLTALEVSCDMCCLIGSLLNAESSWKSPSDIESLHRRRCVVGQGLLPGLGASPIDPHLLFLIDLTWPPD